MKKLIALIMTAIMVCSLVGCNFIQKNDDNTLPDQIKIRIGCPEGYPIFFVISQMKCNSLSVVQSFFGLFRKVVISGMTKD